MPKRGESATPAQREALRRGQAKRAKALRNNKDVPTQGERWRALLDGTLSVSDLEDEEIARMRVYGKGKVFSGPAQRLPSHLIAAFKKEAARRAEDQFRTAAPRAVKRLIEIAEDPDTKDNDAIRALALLLDRALGKVPDTIHIEGDSVFDRLAAEAADLLLDRTMDGMSVADGEQDGQQ